MTEEESKKESGNSTPEEEALTAEIESKYGFPFRDVYKRALKFYKENEGRSVVLSYGDKIALIAYQNQITRGEFAKAQNNLTPLGALDVIGKDRRNAWAALGSMTSSVATYNFIQNVSKLFPLFDNYLQSIKAEKVKLKEEDTSTSSNAAEEANLINDVNNTSRENINNDEGEEEEEEDRRKAEAAVLLVEERQRQEDQRRQIQDALNKQTFTQFRSYAEQQYPSNPDQQAVLIRQLQEQHYYQYMQQIYQQQMESQAGDALVSHGADHNTIADNNLSEQVSALSLENKVVNGSTIDNIEEGNNYQQEDEDEEEEDEEEESVEEEEEEEEEERDDHECTEDYEEEEEEEITPASMWTKKEISLFKNTIKEEGSEAIIKVGQGETVTVRVPTHEDGSAIFWEFATDSYDIAFGLFFEWNKSDDEKSVSVHISDSEDEDIDEDELLDPNDPERASSASLLDKGPPTSVIVPIYRRDCHEEVYAGSHTYPGTGVYLLKFDNTYSLWRSKTLYYRVYYTR